MKNSIGPELFKRIVVSLILTYFEDTTCDAFKNKLSSAYGPIAKESVNQLLEAQNFVSSNSLLNCHSTST